MDEMKRRRGKIGEQKACKDGITTLIGIFTKDKAGLRYNNDPDKNKVSTFAAVLFVYSPAIFSLFFLSARKNNRRTEANGAKKEYRNGGSSM